MAIQRSQNEYTLQSSVSVPKIIHHIVSRQPTVCFNSKFMCSLIIPLDSSMVMCLKWQRERDESHCNPHSRRYINWGSGEIGVRPNQTCTQTAEAQECGCHTRPQTSSGSCERFRGEGIHNGVFCAIWWLVLELESLVRRRQRRSLTKISPQPSHT